MPVRPPPVRRPPARTPLARPPSVRIPRPLVQDVLYAVALAVFNHRMANVPDRHKPHEATNPFPVGSPNFEGYRVGWHSRQQFRSLPPVIEGIVKDIYHAAVRETKREPKKNIDRLCIRPIYGLDDFGA